MIMSHDQLGKIPQSPENAATILQAELDTVEENLEVLKQQGHDVSRGMLKGLIKRKENLTAKIATIQYQMEQNKDAVVDFKQMGIDHIFVDESHQFKNLMFNTRHDRVAGLGNSEGSQRALQSSLRHTHHSGADWQRPRCYFSQRYDNPATRSPNCILLFNICASGKRA